MKRLEETGAHYAPARWRNETGGWIGAAYWRDEYGMGTASGCGHTHREEEDALRCIEASERVRAARAVSDLTKNSPGTP